MKGSNGKLAGLVLMAVLLSACGMDTDEQVPEAWKHLVKTEGQAYPVPESWLSTPEGKIAHNLVLPASVPQPVPFDFEKAKGPWYWRNSSEKVAVKYFEHLCTSEAGEWIFKKIRNTEGLYFARPKGQAEITDDYLMEPYGPEAPAVERHFQLMGDSADMRGGRFVRPPFQNYRYVEEPRREVKWQKAIQEPYIRLFGYTQGYFVKPGQVVNAMNELTPMQVVGISAPTATYGYTWRGITRPQDREYRIAGAELIIYDLHNHEPVGVRRTFAITGKNRRGKGAALWALAPTCTEVRLDTAKNLALTRFADRVLSPVVENPQGVSE